MKLNNKGMSIIEIVLTFSMVMFLVISMFNIVLNYQNKANLNIKKADLIAFKTTLTQDIQNDILKYGVSEMAADGKGECETLSSSLSECINIYFRNGSTKTFGIGRIDENDDDSIINKYLYYDGIKYKLKDELPKNIPTNRNKLDLQLIKISDYNILNKSSSVLQDGSIINIYSIDISISYQDMSEDFGIHITAPDKDITNVSSLTNLSWDFPYTGDEQEFIVPATGFYKLEVWGSEGGISHPTKSNDAVGPGGKGGYSTGSIYLKKNEKISVIVGGNLIRETSHEYTYNGGGKQNSVAHSGNGGGATHMALVVGETSLGELLNYSKDEDKVLIVAGGGGGAGNDVNTKSGSGKTDACAGGSGGGFIGGSGTSSYGNAGRDHHTGIGGTQTEGGAGYRPGAFGLGGRYLGGNKVSAGGGGGWYGGGAGDSNSKDGDLADVEGAGGGSGYIGNKKLYDKKMYAYCAPNKNCSNRESKEFETYTITTSYYEENATSEATKIGQGYARITLLSSSEDVKPPVVSYTTSELAINFTATDENGIVSYGVSINETTEPTYYNLIEAEKKANYNYFVNKPGTYYLWVKDTAGNITKTKIEFKTSKNFAVRILGDNQNDPYKLNRDNLIDIRQIASDVGENGLYMSTATNSGNPTYYFRGVVENNYVKFSGSDIVWRVVRINEKEENKEETIRLIYNSYIPNGDDSSIKFNNNSSLSAHTEYYSNSKIKTELEKWYKKYIIDKGLDSKVEQGSFCEQAKVGLNDTYTNNYNSKSSNSTGVPMVSFDNYNPTFECYPDKNGHGSITAKYGLITFDEVVYAGGMTNAKVENSKGYGAVNFYLKSAGARSFWTMTPAGSEKNDLVSMWISTTNYYVNSKKTNAGSRYRPVINVKANLSVTSGSGTKKDPYIIS